MKKLFLMLLVVTLLAISVTPVFAGGGQVTGDRGEGSTHQEFENGCIDQPCFDVAERPQNGKN